MRSSGHSQSGFSLVEMMIAMAIGLIIILGAGQLFLMGLQNFRLVELLGNKQAALTYSAEMIIRDIRRSDNGFIDWDDSTDPHTLSLQFRSVSKADGCNAGEVVGRDYYVSDGEAISPSEGWALMMKQQCGSLIAKPEPLVTGFGPNGQGLKVIETDEENGIYKVTFCLIAEPGDEDCDSDSEGITFHAVNRVAALAK
ncbi:PilW family protein [Halomonas icarae]|uniref:Prepilin-type N-terminal cleavage/methylation domain-containing protein n=1 Tax=Halomonas icarae TaxID=2691040 RepID=A0A7X5ANV5_9GAMM|nr:prepilin-type N-terminal cleavage/methylation domain-containing protein [Halomonas icarae]MDR5903577.1 prepilin-type N-terminal cleavage/methylation domain-containing protein [Halomonas icarae]NAW14028.1 prepilin-type N-terminal cleavage/methylation domain-containing protein [Halomonas icarae]